MRKTNSSKSLLGTVQFGLRYGINYSRGIPNDHELIKIFDLAKKSSIKLLDTPYSYGDAQLRSGKLSQNYFNCVSMCLIIDSLDELSESLNNTLKALGLDKIYGYLAHDADS